MVVNAAEKFGFAGPFGWLANQSWWAILLTCLLIAPGAMMLIAPVLEARWLPLSRQRQFRALFPGDIFLSLAVALLLYAGRNLPEHGWWQAGWWHAVVFVGAVAVAVGLTVMEVKAPADADYAWPPRARTSPTKLYHNFALYALYGYLAVSALVACFAGGLWLDGVVALAAASPWLYFLLTDNSVGEEVRLARLRYAHIKDWRPVWANGWRVRRQAEL